MFVILQKYDFSSKSQHRWTHEDMFVGCLWYCKSTIFQANHNSSKDNAIRLLMFVILQKYDFSSKSQPISWVSLSIVWCLWYCKSTIFQANHNLDDNDCPQIRMFVILQKYDFSSKSQPRVSNTADNIRCLWYCKSTIFQANHNQHGQGQKTGVDVCDTAKVRFFKQITTRCRLAYRVRQMFVILQKYDFSSKSQPLLLVYMKTPWCLWYCKSTIFQANHN